MTVEGAVQTLDRLGSAHDPIHFRGEEITPDDLPYLIKPYRSAVLRIRYWTVRDGKPRMLNGTLSGMVRDRKRDSPPFKRQPCPTCGRK